MNSGDILGIAGIAASLIGIPVAFILARKSRQRPQLRYAVDFNTILSTDDKLFDRGLKMTLGDKRIDSISRTRVALWNHHGDTIERSDNLESDRLRLNFDREDSVLQSRVLRESRPQIALSATFEERNASIVDISFDFLDAEDGGIIEVIHQGTVEPKLLGTIKGCTIRRARSVHTDLSEEAIRAIPKSRLGRILTYGPLSRRIVIIAGLIIISIGVASICIQLAAPHAKGTPYGNIILLIWGIGLLVWPFVFFVGSIPRNIISTAKPGPGDEVNPDS